MTLHRQNKQGPRGDREQKAGDRLLALRCLLGALGAQQWMLIVGMMADAYRGDSLSLEFIAPLLAAYMVTCGVTAGVFAVARDKDVLGSGVFAALAGALFSCLGALLLMFSGDTFEYRLFLFVAVGLCLGLGTCLLLMPWTLLADRAPRRTVDPLVFVFAAAFCALAAFSQVVGATGATLFAVAVVLALVSAGCWIFPSLRLGAGEVEGANAVAAEAAPAPATAGADPAVAADAGAAQAKDQKTWPTGNGALRVGVAFVCIGFAFAMMISLFLIPQIGSASTFTWVFGFAGVACAAVPYLVCRLRRAPWDVLFAFRFVPLLTIVAFFPLDLGVSGVSIEFSLGASTLALWFFFTLSLGVVVEAARILHAPLHRSAAFGVGGMCLGAVAGYAVGVFSEVMGTSGLFTSVASIVAMCLSFVGSNIAVNRSALAKAYRATLVPAADPAAAKTLSLEKQLDAIAAAYGLTKRETDVALILAQGYGLKRVQEDLFISEGTAITHRRHIYQKLDVHSKSELIDFVSRYAPANQDDQD